MRENPYWDEQWRDHSGVYYCIRGSDGAVVDVGKASPGFLRYRVWSLLRSGYSRVPDATLNDPLTVIGMIVFDDADWYWALSLEAFLIRKLKPECSSEFKG